MNRTEKAQKLQQKEQELATISQVSTELQNAHLQELETNPKYSLDVDPENKYGMSEVQKTFIRHYVNFKNVNTAAELTGIDQEVAKQYFVAWSSQQEIRRINLALYQRQFANRLITLDEIGGYLTSLLTGEFVPMGEQLKINDKLRVVQMLIDLNKFKSGAIQDPTVIMARDINLQLKNLSVTTIRQLIDTKASIEEKQDVVEIFDENSSLSPEEQAYLTTLPTDQLLELIEQTNKGKDETNDT